MRWNFSEPVTFCVGVSPVLMALIVFVLVAAGLIHCLQPSAFSNLSVREVTASSTSAFSNWICCRNSGLENFILSAGGCVRGSSPGFLTHLSSRPFPASVFSSTLESPVPRIVHLHTCHQLGVPNDLTHADLLLFKLKETFLFESSSFKMFEPETERMKW